MEKHQTYFNFLDALKEKGCSICFLMAKSTHKMIDDFLYEQVNDPKVRQDIHASMGFCNIHSWQMQKFGDALGMSIIYEDLLGILETKVKEHPDFLDRHFFKPDYYQASKEMCPICKHSKEVGQRYITSFKEYYGDVEFSSQYKNSFGFCLHHLIEVINACHDKKITDELKESEIKKWDSLRQELKEFIRKTDYRFSKEGFGPEGDAWIRAMEKMEGKEGVHH